MCSSSKLHYNYMSARLILAKFSIFRLLSMYWLPLVSFPESNNLVDD